MENTVGLISKGELPAIEYSGRQQDPIIESVLYALNNEDYALVLKQIQLGREKIDILDVDRMHLDWMEIQVMLILERYFPTSFGLKTFQSFEQDFPCLLILTSKN